MKKMSLFLFLLITLSSCSSNDYNEGATDANAFSFLPLEVGKSWVYNVSNSSVNIGRDSLYIVSEEILNGKSYNKYAVNDVTSGFYSGILNGNFVRVDGGKVFMTGAADISAVLAQDLSLNPIELNDFVVFDALANNGTVLSSKSGSFNQSIQDLPVTFEYEVTSSAGNTYDQFTLPNGDSYSNVKEVKLKMNLAITANVFIPIPIMTNQEVVISTLYYAENFGVVFVKTIMNYELQELPLQLDLPIPASYSDSQTEVLNR